MNRDQLEFAVSQYAEGGLSADQEAALKQVIEGDPEAEKILEVERSLSSLLAVGLGEVPAVDYEQLFGNISQAVAQADAPQVKTYRIGSWNWPARLALAASVLIVGFVGYHFYAPSSGPVISNGVAVEHPQQIANAPRSSTQIQVLTAAISSPSAASAVSRIAIGPSPAAATAALGHYEGVFSSRSGKVAISAGLEPADKPDFPY